MRYSMANFEYYAIAIDEESRERLLGTFAGSIPVDWTVIAHHMTIVHRSKVDEDALLWARAHDGEEVTLKVGAFGESKGAIAVGVYPPGPCANVRPHITLAVPPGGRPVNSNKITEWTSVEVFELKGRVVRF